MYGAAALLFVAIATEVAATSALPRTNGFRDPGWSALVIAGYAASIWMLAIVTNYLPVSTTYAVWAGLGTAMVAVVGVLWLGESWDWAKIAAIAMIVIGVVALNLNGAHSAH